MIVNEKLKLNKFRLVSIPRNRDLYERVGGRIPSMKTEGNVSSLGLSKLDLLQQHSEQIESDILKDNLMPLDTDLPD